ncbi:hypothetical protein B0H13DRAFT_2490092 [Mycena leptocephala]|nr:hypothetical protein B0H13DRAFT_2490092 [Mycena leptocephala]
MPHFPTHLLLVRPTASPAWTFDLWLPLLPSGPGRRSPLCAPLYAAPAFPRASLYPPPTLLRFSIPTMCGLPCVSLPQSSFFKFFSLSCPPSTSNPHLPLHRRFVSRRSYVPLKFPRLSRSHLGLPSPPFPPRSWLMVLHFTFNAHSPPLFAFCLFSRGPLLIPPHPPPPSLTRLCTRLAGVSHNPTGVRYASLAPSLNTRVFVLIFVSKVADRPHGTFARAPIDRLKSEREAGFDWNWVEWSRFARTLRLDLDQVRFHPLARRSAPSLPSSSLCTAIPPLPPPPFIPSSFIFLASNTLPRSEYARDYADALCLRQRGLFGIHACLCAHWAHRVEKTDINLALDLSPPFLLWTHGSPVWNYKHAVPAH